MPRKIVDKTSFLGGEAGPLLEGRSDLPQFQLGANKLENFIAMKNGAITRRPGTRYVKNTESNKPARLTPFIISYDDPTKMYVVEITLASSTSLVFKVIRLSDENTLSVTNGTLTVASTINIDEIQFAQSAEVLFIAHKSFAPQMLYLDGSTFTLTAYNAYVTKRETTSNDKWLSTPYRTANITATTITASATTGTWSGSGTGVLFTASAAFFDSGHVGAFFRHTESATVGYFIIEEYLSSTTARGSVLVTLGGTAGSSDWAEGAWSTYRGFPRTLTFYSQRLVWGGNTNQPDTFWMSQTNDYFQMHSATSGISQPLQFTLASERLNQIRWMVGGKKLTIGTSGAEWVGTVTNDGTNLFIQFDEETGHGSAPVQPSKSAYTIPFVQRSGQQIRELVFDFDSDNYQATDLTLFGSHVGAANDDFGDELGVKIVQMAHQESPFGIDWALDNQGRVWGLTRDKQQQIAAWHSHNFGGSNSDRNDSLPIVKSICVAPDRFGGVDRLWLCVHRKINSVDKYMVEYVDDFKWMPTIEPFRQQTTATINGVVYTLDDIAAHLDCADVSFESPATTAFNNGTFAYMASDTGYFIAMKDTDADGGGGEVVYAGTLSVDASGNITLPVAAKTVVGGFHRGAYARLLHFEGGDEPKLHMNSTKRADNVKVRLHQTFGLKVGANRITRKTGWEENTDFEPIPFWNMVPMASTFTGVKDIPAPTDNDNDGGIAFAMEDPWPCTILSVSSRVVSNEV